LAKFEEKMIASKSKLHWENVYTSKDLSKVSWVQEKPTTSLSFIEGLKLHKSAPIIDIAGGNSNLVDYLLSNSYTNLSVLDISANALEATKKRLGSKAKKVNWIVSNVLNFSSLQNYELWHDRAGFHFLTQEKDIIQYLQVLEKTKPTYLIIGTFSENGPDKCSGLPIKKHSIRDLTEVFSNSYQLIDSKNVNHTTPTASEQNFNFCSFKRKV